jgi:beta-phosphoglucomutase-like phosphatase (HAD superfamily)
MKKAVLFDLDGTLLSIPIDYETMKPTLNRLAALWGIERVNFLKMPILECIDIGASQVPKKDRLPFIGACMKIIDYFERQAAFHAKPIFSSKEAIDLLRDRGKLTAVVSRNSLACVAVSLFITEMFCNINVVVGREMTKKPKPDPEPLLYAMKWLGVEPEECLFLGDHKCDEKAAKGANIEFCPVGLSAWTKTPIVHLPSVINLLGE